MLNKEQIEQYYQAVVDYTYGEHGCDVSVQVVPIMDQAILAIELQERLDFLADKFGSIAPDRYIKNLEEGNRVNLEMVGEMQAKLDAIEKWARELRVFPSNQEGTIQGGAYYTAQMAVLMILEG